MFNEGKEHYDGSPGYSCAGIWCDECIYCCNVGDENAKIKAFAEYAKSKGYEITRPGYVAEPVIGCNQLPAGMVTQPDGKMTIRFKRLHPDAKAPYQATPGSAGFDLTAVYMEPVEHTHRRIVKYGTGLAVEIPSGYVGLVFPRSSVYKADVQMANCVGVIDSDYRGEITAVFYVDLTSENYAKGDRIAQLVIMPIPAVKFVESEELTDTERGIGGYGSTGR
jgi:dUTP pyrophosphatase